MDRHPVAGARAPRHDRRMLDPDFVLDDEGRDRLITRFGAGVDAWCTGLPELVDGQTKYPLTPEEMAAIAAYLKEMTAAK